MKKRELAQQSELIDAFLENTVLSKRVEVLLGSPIEVGGKRLEVLVLRQPTHNEVERVMQGEPGMEWLLRAVAVTSGLSRQAVDRLSMRDVMACLDAMTPLLNAHASALGRVVLGLCGPYGHA